MMKKVNIEILYETDSLVAVNKPAGLLTIPDRYDTQESSLLEELENIYDTRLWILHRLDKDTSGVVLFARNAETHHDLSALFMDRRVHKTYYAVVHQAPTWETRLIDLPLCIDADRRHRTKVDPQRGKPSQTRVTVEQLFRRHSLLKVEPLTGRTHQIRAHLTAIGHPIIGDALYGDEAEFYLSTIKRNFNLNRTGIERPIIARCALHSHSLHFDSTSNATISIEAPFVKDFRALVRQLSKLS
jgi:23S rRNA pseudouridine955/2504/2580 synthase/23S rRNA pseudouridine1911/1915/1917 synthase